MWLWLLMVIWQAWHENLNRSITNNNVQFLGEQLKCSHQSEQRIIGLLWKIGNILLCIFSDSATIVFTTQSSPVCLWCEHMWGANDHHISWVWSTITFTNHVTTIQTHKTVCLQRHRGGHKHILTQWVLSQRFALFYLELNRHCSWKLPFSFTSLSNGYESVQRCHIFPRHQHNSFVIHCEISTAMRHIQD